MGSKTTVKNISIFGAFALSLGTAIGWGSFVVTGSNFVSQAGPVGSIIGILIGMVMMCIVAYNYHYMMNKYPETNGGIYTYAKRTLGGDHAFLVAWFLIITYSAILWANVSSFALFARYLFGNTFQFGFHYSLGGYDVWLGELLLSSFFLFLFGGICLLKKKISTHITFGMVLLFIAVIVAGTIIALIMHEGGVKSYKPDFAPVKENKFLQIMKVISMTPWAFIGFESISHSSNNFSFKHKKSFSIMLGAIITAGVLYLLLCQLAVTAFPDTYDNWYEYLQDSGSLSGTDAIPAFYVAKRFMGTTGVVLFAVALFAVIATSIVGNIFALTGLIGSMTDDGITTKYFKKKDKNDNSINIIISIILLTFVMLFFGRVLIGWIVDVNNICGVIIFSYIGAIAIYQARKEKNKKALTTGIIGLIIGLGFAIYFVISSLFTSDWIEQESIMIFFIWAIIGFIYYASILKRDKKKVFGHSMAAIFGLFVLIIYSIGAWLVLLMRSNRDVSTNVWAISISVLLLIATQIVFFFVFGIIRHREVEMHEKLVLGMATMVEGRDNSTGGHIKRTSKVVELIVNEMIKNDTMSSHHRFYANVIKAAPMHDLGKITVDDAVLRKPGKFTPEEYEHMKKHSPEGAKIVKEILDGSSDEYFQEIAVNVAHYHHERWDGNGYPNHLKGEEIPLEARIMAIADVYDALVSKRVYKDEFSFEEANKIILDGMGKQFDPGLEKYYLAAKDKIEEFYSLNK